MMADAERIVLVQNDDGTGVVLDRQGGRYYQLNAVATIILHRILEGDSVADVEQHLLQGHSEISEERIASDVETAVASFTVQGWIRS